MRMSKVVREYFKLGVRVFSLGPVDWILDRRPCAETRSFCTVSEWMYLVTLAVTSTSGFPLKEPLPFSLNTS